jgi:hypothetical protein
MHTDAAEKCTSLQPATNQCDLPNPAKEICFLRIKFTCVESVMELGEGFYYSLYNAAIYN